MKEWNKYSEVKPEKAGVYMWRMDGKAVPDRKVIARAEYRWRGTCGEDVLSPRFDYWDGYRVHVPANLEWMEDDGSLPDISYEDLPAAKRCPFCKKIPVLKSAHRYPTGGVLISAKPYELNSFSFFCCGWTAKPCFESPVLLIEAWNKALSVGGDE